MSLNRTVTFICSLLLLMACNPSASSLETSPDTSPDTKPDDSSNGETVTEVLPEVIQEDILCNGLAKLNFIQAITSDQVSAYDASNTIDNNFMAESRWSTAKNEESLVLTFAAPALIKGVSITWLNNDNRSYSYDLAVSKDQKTWISVLSSELSNAMSSRAQYIEITEHTANHLKITVNGNTLDDNNHIVEVEAFGCKTDIASVIELDDWYLSIPVDDSLYSKAQSIKESTLTSDYFNAEFFFLDVNGGQVFRAPIEGAKTSTNTSYTRTELREMLRRGDTSISTQGINENNWVFSSASNEEQQAAGGVDGELFAELAVNYVTKTGDRAQVGRVIIGQIHANDDEPIRVYYRKLPENDKGSIYLAHETLGGEDSYYELIGTRSKSAVNPENGIKLNERFAYRISVVGNQLTFTLSRSQQEDISTIIDMSNSGYDLGKQYMYFKAGVYNQNNTGEAKDYVQATFYSIENSHSNYVPN